MSKGNTIHEYDSLHLEGIYRIVSVELDEYKYKENRYVVFPMKARLNKSLMFLYVKFDNSNHGSEGRVFNSHKLLKIETIGIDRDVENMDYVDSVKLSVDDNKWLLKRVY